MSKTEENIAEVRQIVRENHQLSEAWHSKRTSTEKRLGKS
jgi:hypothetical protein